MHVRPLFLLIGAFLILGGVFVWRLGSQDGAMRCNGLPQLCDRRVDQVTFAGTHNSMAAANEGWLVANQDEGVPAQLRHGIRALLIDTQYWETDDDVRALVRGSPAAGGQLQAFLRGLNKTPIPGPLLCHTFCALGSRPLVDGLSDIRHFLDANRNEVLIVIFEDSITNADLEASFLSSGLSLYVYDRPAGRPWPTLRELIERDQRLIVFSERGASGPSWYAPAWQSIQDTRFGYPSVDAFDCARNRGPATNSLLLVNHWLGGIIPSRDNAVIANLYDVLKRRVDTCTAQRGQAPNILAVDFAETGDLLRVVRELNAGPR